MASPFFTVVIPVYKGMDFLEGCAESLKAQTFRDFEALFIEDGSPDNSGALCDRLAAGDERFFSLHQPNGGVTSARNHGIRAARGRWLLFLDQDDRFAPGLLQAVFKALGQASPEDLIHWAFTGSRQEAGHLPPQAEGEPFRFYSQAELGLFYRAGNTHYIWTKLFSVDFLRENSLYFDESIQDGTDDLPFVAAYWHAWFSRHPQGRILYLKTPYYYYEMGNEASVSNRLQPYQPSHLAMFADLLRDYRTLYGVPEKDCFLLCRQALHTLSYGLYSARGSARRRAARQLWNAPECRRLLDFMGKQHFYSPFYLPWKARTAWLCAALFGSFLGRRLLYEKCDWLGWYLLGGSWERI